MMKYPNFGINISDSQTTSYIYLYGIKPEREIVITPNLVLRSTKSSPDPQDMIENVMKYGDQSEFSLGMIIAFLRRITAELVISDPNPKNLAIRTWNSQHICIILSAMLKCVVEFPFQADNSVEKFDAHTHLNIINPKMLNISSKSYTIDNQTCDYIEKNMSIAMDLDNNDRFGTAANALWCYKVHFRPAVQMSVIWGGIESLFLIERGIRNKLSKAISRFLNSNDDLIEEIKALYDLRSQAVHELKTEENIAIEKSADVLNKLIKRCIELRSLPDTSFLIDDSNWNL